MALRRLSIRRKLMLILMIASGAALVLANLALIGIDLYLFRSDLERDLTTLSAVVAASSTAALTFDDGAAARETLGTLRARPVIAAAALYRADGSLLAFYKKPGGTGTVPPRARPDTGGFGRDSFSLFTSVTLDHKRVGTLYLESRLDELYRRLRLQAATISAILLLAAAVSYALFARLQRFISEPILSLAATARAVEARQDYSLRAERQSADELGQLADDFNRMLARIEERDDALERAKDELERRVEERTRELAERNVELAQSNRELDDFAYIASHDLKEPLRGIHNFAVFLLEDYGEKLDAEGRSKLETLPRLTRRMDDLIDSLLQFSRVGRVDLAIDHVDLGEIVAGVVESLAVGLAEQGVEVRVPRPLPTVRCDRARVGEIFRNLVANAVKYNDKPRKWVEIGYQDSRRDGEGRRPPVFYVRDNGIGIPPKHFDAIFRIFKRLHGRDQFGGGTGAGLTIVKKIVERHHGRVWVESAPGEGTTFFFTLERGA